GQPHLHPSGTGHGGPGGRGHRDHQVPRRPVPPRPHAGGLVPPVRDRHAHRGHPRGSGPGRLPHGGGIRRGPPRLPGPGRVGRGRAGEGQAPRGRGDQPPHRARGDGSGLRAHRQLHQGRRAATGDRRRAAGGPVKRAGAAAAALVMAGGLLAGCSSSKHASLNRSPVTRKDPRPATGSTLPRTVETLPPAGTNVYAHTLSAKDLSPAVAGVPSRVYVTNSESNAVDVIDPETMTIIDHFPTQREPQHVTPSWDMKTLYVDNDLGNTLIPIDPMTGKPGPPMPVDDPYNLYFTQDGSKAIVVAERFRRLDFRDPHTWKLLKTVPVPCSGVDHGDPTADGKEMLLSCEFSGDMVRVDVVNMELIGMIHVGGQPIDVKLAPDGTKFYVANQQRNGVSVIDASRYVETDFIPTGKGAHGLYPSRD